MVFNIYTSNEREPTYTTDVGCTCLGTLTLDMPDTSKGKNRGAFVHMTFSGTEITVTALDKDDPTKTTSTNVDFLGKFDKVYELTHTHTHIYYKLFFTTRVQFENK